MNKPRKQRRKSNRLTIVLVALTSLWLAAFIVNGLHSSEAASAQGGLVPDLPETAAPTPFAPGYNLTAQVSGTQESFLPVVFNLASGFPPTPTPTPTPSPLPPPTPMTGTTPINFDDVRQTLPAQGLDLAFNKIGFHTGPGPGGNITGLSDWMEQLDAAGVPFFLKSTDTAEHIFAAQQLIATSGISHTLVYRRSVRFPGEPFYNPDVPDYNKSPKEAAWEHWEKHKAAFPPELDLSLVWFETINEVDKNRSEWLAEFALETAKLTLAEGYKWAAFGWSSGEPEPGHWESPAMLEFLQLVADHPDQLAIALHEYSYKVDDIGRWYPYLVGRFQTLFDICDRHGIPRPPVMITEWGWEYDHVPAVAPAMEDIQWAAWLYAAYPQVKGVAIWYLGPSFGDIADEAQHLIAPVGDYSVNHYFAYDPGHGSIDTAIFQP